MGKAQRRNGRQPDPLYVPARVRELVGVYIRTPEQLQGLILNFREGAEREDAARRLTALFARQADDRARGLTPSPSPDLPSVVEWPKELETMRHAGAPPSQEEPDRTSALATH